MRFIIVAVLTFIGTAFTNLQARDNTTIGIVNFTTCFTDSKHGKKEQENFEKLKKQMTSSLEASQKELQELSAKLEDQEYLDGISPKAEEELKLKFQTKSQELSSRQNQFYQIMQQANMQAMQKMSDSVAKASEAVAQKKNLGIVMNKEACFYHKPNLEVTNLVIEEMNKSFDSDEKKRKLAENTASKAIEKKSEKKEQKAKK